MQALCVANETNDLSDQSLDAFAPVIGRIYTVTAIDKQTGFLIIPELQPPHLKTISFEPENFEII
jgi:hypothetical protein